MTQEKGKTLEEATSTVEVEKTNKQAWAEIVEKTNTALQKLKKKKARLVEKKAS